MLDSTVHDDDYDDCDNDAVIMLVVVILVDALVIMILDTLSVKATADLDYFGNMQK